MGCVFVGWRRKWWRNFFLIFFEGPMVMVSDRHIGGVRTGTASGRPMSARVFGHTPSAQ
jgi:hypothetical protein